MTKDDYTYEDVRRYVKNLKESFDPSKVSPPDPVCERKRKSAEKEKELEKSWRWFFENPGKAYEVSEETLLKPNSDVWSE